MPEPLHKQNKRGYKPDINRVRRTYTTRDGRVVKIRLLHPEDTDLLVDFFHRMSPETRRRRFHITSEGLSEDFIEENARALANVDNLTQGGAVIALYEEEDGQEHIIGSARLARRPGRPDSPEAEAAIVVRDDFHGQGLGTELLRRMVLLARQMNVKTIIAVFEAENEGAIRLFRELGLPTKIDVSQGETTLRMTAPE
jgi:RimJ/RimL family protein N-acetyltransferase